MPSCNSLMILRLFYSDTFEKRLAVPAFVEVIAYYGIPSGLSQPSFVSILWGVAGLEILDIGGGLVVGLGRGGIAGWGVG